MKNAQTCITKQYHRVDYAIYGKEKTALVAASVCMGIESAGLLGTIIFAPIVLRIGCAYLAWGLLGVAGKFISRCLTVKAKKLDEIRVQPRANSTPLQIMCPLP